MSVVGFDIGNETCKIAVARNRGIDVLQNEVGKRKTFTYIAYGDKQRFLGDEATAQYGSNIKNTLVYFKRFLGMTKGDPQFEIEQKYANYKTISIGDRAGFEVSSYDGEVIQLMPEQACAAMLTKLKAIAEAGLENQKVTDCVIAVPTYWNDQQRRAMLSAAKISGLNVLRLMNDSTAVALNWGILKNLEDKTHKVVFVDMGISQTTASVVEFAKGKLQVLSTSSDENLGGRDFDSLLMDHFADYILEKYKMDVRTNVKAMIKLRKECERIKLVLSANTKVPFNVEFIMNDRDVSGLIERHEFEVMLQPLLDRFLGVVKKALDTAKVTPADLFACEIVGGATRIPILQTKLTEFFGSPLSKTCDADESVARGSALQCAMLSPSFRVREFSVQDVSAFPISIQWGAVDDNEEPTEDNKQTVFEAHSAFPSVKMISFKDRIAPFKLVAKYVDPPTKGTNPVLGSYVVSGMSAPEPDKPVPKIKVRVKMDIHGIVSISGAQVLHIIEEDVEMKDEVKPAEAEAKPADATPEAADASAPAGDEGAKKMDTSEEVKEEAKDAEKPEVAEKKTKVRKEALNVQGTTQGLDQKTLDAYVEKEAQNISQDRAVAATHEARNALESYVLEMRNEVESGGDLSPYIQEAAASAFVEQMTTMEDWLYEDGENAQKSEYVAQLDKLKKVGDPVVNRSTEFKKRPDAIAAVNTEIASWETLLANPTEKDAHITAEKRAEVKAKCEETSSWLSAQLAKQEKLPLYEDPVLTCNMLASKHKELRNMASKIMNAPKPKPPKEEKKEEASKEAKPEDPKAEAKPEDPKAEAKPEDATNDTEKMDTATDI